MAAEPHFGGPDGSLTFRERHTAGRPWLRVKVWENGRSDMPLIQIDLEPDEVRTLANLLRSAATRLPSEVNG
jgi:hypothetical protein